MIRALGVWAVWPTLAIERFSALRGQLTGGEQLRLAMHVRCKCTLSDPAMQPISQLVSPPARIRPWIQSARIIVVSHTVTWKYAWPDTVRTPAVPGSARAGKSKQPYDWMQITKTQPCGGLNRIDCWTWREHGQSVEPDVKAVGTEPRRDSRRATKQSFETKQTEFHPPPPTDPDYSGETGQTSTVLRSSRYVSGNQAFRLD